MSRAGKYSSEGDAYQLQIALDWCISLLRDETIKYLMIDVKTLPNGLEAKIDDIVIEYHNGKKGFIQAKKNETNHSSWSLSNSTLIDEIQKAYQQYKLNNSNPNYPIYFYSSTPFGEFQKVVQDISQDKLYSSYLVAPNTIKSALKKIAKIIKQDEKETFDFLLSIRFGSTKNIEEWNRDNLERLQRMVQSPQLAKAYLESILEKHQIGHSDIPNQITTKYLEEELIGKGLSLVPQYDESEILKDFQIVSKIGRGRDYSINGKFLIQKDQDDIIKILEKQNGSVIITDRAGSGKSYLLDTIAQYFESNKNYGVLFLKGDEFSKVANDQEFVTKYNVPKDIIGKTIRLSEYRKVVVIIDSLDVIALNKEYGTLRYFISIINRLEGIDNISLLVASRTFDLKYEPLLRDKKWDKKIELQKYDFDNDISPFLNELGIATNAISPKLKTLLIVPQNLNLFVLIHDKIIHSSISTEYELFDYFIEEIITKDELLGNRALEILEKMAHYCIKNRTMNIPKSYLSKEHIISQRLQSQGIIEIEQKSIKVTHQTLIDIFIIYSSFERDENYLEFILSKPQFPFIRPVVRSYLFILYSSIEGKQFQKQIIQVLQSKEVAYHLKRLIVESLAELEYTQENWRLLQRVYRLDQYLFERFFNVIKDYDWFEVIQSQLLVSLSEDEKSKWLRMLLFRSNIFVNAHSQKLINWYSELVNNQIDKELLYPILFALDKLNNVKFEKIYEILEYGLSSYFDIHFVGKILSRYIDQTTKGDELLWKFITRDINEEDFNKYDIKLHCEEHQFYKDTFLKERFSKSAYLLTQAFYTLEEWSSKMYGDFLNSSSSYEKRHKRGDMRGIGIASNLVKLIENAIMDQAKEYTTWWREFEEKLLIANDFLFIYILMQIYEQDVIHNINNVSNILTNKEVIDNSDLKDEYLSLLNKSFPYLDEKKQFEIQFLILTMNEDKENFDEYIDYYRQDTYDYLLYIPSYLRTEEVQYYIDQYSNKFGLIRKSPSLNSVGGFVGSPILANEFNTLSTEWIIRLFDHYNKIVRGWDSEYTDRGLVGGKRLIESMFRNVVSLNPIKYLYLIDALSSNKKYKSYYESLIQGISTYIDYVDGNLSQPKDFERKDDIDTVELANILLKQVEKNCDLLDKYTIIHLLQSCSYLLDDEGSIVRIVSLLYPIFFSSKYVSDAYNYEDNERIDTLNSISGIMGGIVIRLSHNYSKSKHTLPKILKTLLLRLSRDGTNNSKVAILDYLPSLIDNNKILGWKIFDNIIQTAAIPKVLERTYYCLYYTENYGKQKI